MYKGNKIAVVIPAWNEAGKIELVLQRINQLSDEFIDEILVIDDGSDDKTREIAISEGAHVESLPTVMGVGASIRLGYQLAQDRGCDIAVVMAGNNKDEPQQISRLLDPICDFDYEFVMGSRFLPGGKFGGEMPFYRKITTRLHPILVSLVTNHKVTESTNGFRAIKLNLLDDQRINLDQEWLNLYELEVYLLIKVLQCGYRCTEVPVTKIYPPRSVGQTKMRPIIDWWSILRPILYIGFRTRE